MSELSALLTAFATVLHATCWPVLILGSLVLFRRPIHDFLSTLDRFTVNAGALKLEASTKKYEATALLGIATAQKADVGEMDPTKAVNIAKTIGGFSDQQILRLSGKRILWVDDNPENNAYEQRALEVLGLLIDQSFSTDDALEKLARHHYDLVVSDFGRAGDHQAGYTLLDKLKQQGIRIPFIIYTAGSTPENCRKARTRGAWGQTSNPRELFELVLNALLVQ